MKLVAHLLLIIYFKKVLSHDTVDIERQFNIINNKAVQAPIKRNQTTSRPTRPIFQHYRSRRSKHILVSSISGGEKRDRMDPQVSIRTKIIVHLSKEPRSKPIKITRVLEYKRVKRSLAQHTIRTIWTR